ncbi:hypothetical protein [Herminiimonas aquatilis]|uniref:Uncharacterized protein n=1 Tax=Herminiimonas aquatilis TaxID=345342 RepID=A0ABW2J6Y3_9BURK
MDVIKTLQKKFKKRLDNMANKCGLSSAERYCTWLAAELQRLFQITYASIPVAAIAAMQYLF